MRALRRFLKRLTWWTNKRQDEQRLREEIEAHLALQTEENIRLGLSSVEARRQAVLKFGAVEAVREAYRDNRGLPALEALIQDTRYAFRRLRKAPIFTAATVLTLALGIGATTSIFTLVYAVLLKSLAVANPAQLYRLGAEARCCYWGGYSQDREYSLVSYELYQRFRIHTRGFAELAAFQAGKPMFGIRRSGHSDPAQSYPGEFVSTNYFAMFGLTAYAGRLLTAADSQLNAAPAAVMSYRLWRERYASDSAIVGSTFDLNNKPFTIVGIAPPAFFGDTLRDNPPDFFLPLETEPYVEADADLRKPDTYWLNLIGRVRPDADPASIQAQMRVELKQWLRSHWADMDADERAKFPHQTLYLRPGGAGITSMRGDYEHWLHILMMVSAFVLLIVCANVANLLLVRGMERRRQTSLSVALGARAPRLVTQALTESLLLALLGGAAGLAVAFAGTRLILHFAFPQTAGMPGIPIDASPSIPVLLFVFGVSLITGIAFGIAPAWFATRVDPIEALRGANRSTARTGSLPRKTLIVLQAALSLVLLSASGLLTAALNKLENQPLGFDQDHRLVMNFDPRLAGYTPPQLTPLYSRIHDSLAAIPGVSAAALCNYSPLGDDEWGAGVYVEDHPDQAVFTFWDRVSSGYFEAIGNPMVRGRDFSAQDTAASRHVAIVNEAFARRFFKNEDAVGKYFGQVIGAPRQYEIVGVSRDVRYLNFDLEKPVPPLFFLAERQHDFAPATGSPEISPGSHFMHDIIVVTRPGANLSDAQLLRAMAAVDPNLPVSIHTLKQQVFDHFRQQRLIARITSLFGVLSLVLSSIGLYGVTAHNAGRRASEIAVRIALGASRRDIVALILRGAFALILFGLVVGIPLTFAAGRFLGRQLYGINPYSPTLTLLAAATLALCALAASLVPALRASSTPALDSLRME